MSGLTNAPGTFQRVADIILVRLKWKTYLVDLDDIIVFLEGFQSHKRHAAEIITLLQASGLPLKLRKCKFFSKTVDYLGHVVRPGRLAVAEKNTAAVKRATYPTTRTQMRSFLGMCNVYRRFVPNSAGGAAPLTQYTSKNGPNSLLPPSDNELRAFELLKNALTSPPILSLPGPDLPYSVDTDASRSQIGAAFFQEFGEDRLRHPIGFWSHALSETERNYSSTERECLGVIWALQILRPYLEFKKFDLYTDHSALKWLMSIVDPGIRMTRWRFILSEFDFEVKYRRRSQNQVAVAISRLPTFRCATPDPKLEMATFLIENDAETRRNLVNNRFVVSSWMKCNSDPYENQEDEKIIQFVKGISAFAVKVEAEISAMTLEKVRQAQEKDSKCKVIRKQIEVRSVERNIQRRHSQRVTTSCV